MKMHLNDGEAYIKGRSPETAARLLQSAKDGGHAAGTVRTTSYGYIVPQELAGEESTTSMTGRKLARNASSLDEAQAVVADRPSADGIPSGDEPESETGGYDPADYTVDEVEAYLDSADDAERQRVIAAETAGKNRKGITSYAAEGDK